MERVANVGLDRMIAWAMVFLISTAMICGAFYCLVFVDIPEKNNSTIYFVLGQVLTVWAAAAAWVVGGSKGSSDKDRLLAESVPVERANIGSKPPEPTPPTKLDPPTV